MLDDERNTGLQSWNSPRAMFRSLALTMRRCVEQECPVDANELVLLLDLFRTLWEEIVANGDLAVAHDLALKPLLAVREGDRVSSIYEALYDDAVRLVRPPPTTPGELGRRKEVAARYGKVVGKTPVICMARAAEAVAEASLVLYTALGQAHRYQVLFTADVLEPLISVLVMPRQPWSTVLAEHLRNMRSETLA
ncbi:hypothetical protein [Duganella vulcania]|uniref:Uncharacterized protein n=1 Tax=Duganella vulcania TaxID=2692166 RepID=A0A845GI44_9BURK|nr:hypothetical protein [Duganella vulcania]MYM92437.1 hypothetical protein [Duganella vulcania]